MFVKQIDRSEAFRLANTGTDIGVLVPGPEGSEWEEASTTTLSKMLEGCVFFRKEVAAENPDFEAAVHEMEDQIPHHAEVNEAGVSGGKQKKRVDRGKVLALHQAGRSNKWIAEDMGLHEGTVCRVLREMKEENG